MKKINLLLIFAAVQLMYGCSNEVKDITENNNSINIISSISPEGVLSRPALDEDGKGSFLEGDIFSLFVYSPEKKYVVNDFIVGTSDFKWKDLNLSSTAGKVNFSACYPKQVITDGKFIFNSGTSGYKDLLMANVADITFNSKEPVYMNFKHAMHKLVISYVTDEEMSITTRCTALSVCEVDMMDNSLNVKCDERYTFEYEGANVSFLLVPQDVSNVTLEINYGEKNKLYNLNELITNSEFLEGGKRLNLTVNIKNGDIQLQNPVIGSWEEQGSVNGNVIM